MKTSPDLLQSLQLSICHKNCHLVTEKGTLIFNKNMVQKKIRCNVLTNDVPMWSSVHGVPVPADI